MDMAEWTIDCWNGFAEYLNQERKLPDDEDRKANRTFNMCYPLWEGRRRGVHGNARLSHGDQVRHQHGAGAASEPSAYHRLSLAGVQVQTKVNEDTGMVTFFTEETEQVKRDEAERINSMAPVRDEVPEEKPERGSRSQEPTLDEEPLGRSIGSKMQHRFTWKNHARPSLSHSENMGPQPSRSGSNICLAFRDKLEDHTHTLFLPLEYASFGHAVVTGDFDGDGNPDFAIAAPHLTLDPMVPSQGAVFIVPSQALSKSRGGDIDVRSIASRALHGDPDEPQSRFGWSLAVVDLNRDGIDDLAIGAPGRGAKNLKYDGSVFVYFGHQDSGLSQEPDLVIYHDRAKEEELRIPAGMKSLAGLGYKLQGLDLTGSGFKDLLIGMPMATTYTTSTNESRHSRFKPHAGKIVAFLSQAMHSGHKLDSDHDWELKGEDAFGWFGASFTVISRGSYENTPPSPSKRSSLLSWFDSSLLRRDSQATQTSIIQKILVVGSPTFGLGEHDAMRGKIQGYVVPDFTRQSSLRGSGTVLPPPTPRRVFTIHGDNKFGQLGSSLVPNHIRPSSVPHLTRQFPSGVPIELLVIGSRSENILNHLPKIGRQWQAGMVRILDISKLPDGTDVKISDLDAIPDIVRDSLHGSQSMAHLSAAMEVSTDGKSLWLTEPYAKREAGRILEWEPDFKRRGEDEGHNEGKRSIRRGSRRKDMFAGVSGRRKIPELRHGDGGDDDDDDDDGDDHNHNRVKQCFFGADYRGRFGSQLLIEDLNKDGLDDIVVTSSHASQFAT